MSTDQIFAAQMWSWTDPMIKRDSQGRILVVNAAFLQLYGGTVENWTGNPIQGWPQPKSPGEISRFESRIPLPTGGETVYDWMECTHRDGTAIAMARDVTAYAAAQNAYVGQPPVEPAAQPVAQQQFANEPVMESPSQATPSATDFVEALSPAAPPVEAAPSPAPAVAAAVTAATVTAMAAAPAATQPEPQMLEPQAELPPAQVPANAPLHAPAEAVLQPISEPQAQPAAASPVVAPLPVEAPVAAQTQPESRDFERRALPIENDDAILGNNWRDAVIAKAVGVEDFSEETSEEQDGGAPSFAKENGEQIKVLLAEDNAINALLTRTLLEAEGCLCDVVEDGALSVEAVKNNDYDLVFMDMRMPNMDGLEATRKIRAMGYNAKVLPIVALTANAFDDDRNACFDSGMNDFMTKPVSAEELSAMVKTHTELTTERIAS